MELRQYNKASHTESQYRRKVLDADPREGIHGFVAKIKGFTSHEL